VSTGNLALKTEDHAEPIAQADFDDQDWSEF
jgi:hypothetical protein